MKIFATDRLDLKYATIERLLTPDTVYFGETEVKPPKKPGTDSGSGSDTEPDDDEKGTSGYLSVSEDDSEDDSDDSLPRLPRRVISLDADGYIFNRAYHEDAKNADEKVRLLTANRELLNEIKHTSEFYKKTTLMVGSNRQCPKSDDMNSDREKTSSCYDAIELLAEDLDVDVDPLLLSDVYNDETPGTNFSIGLQNSLIGLSRKLGLSPKPLKEKYRAGREDSAFWIPDASKVTIIYGQTHKQASENPYEPFVYEFHDDNVEIIDGLYAFYSKHPDLLPAGVTVRFRQRNETRFEKKPPIVGKGAVDANYKHNLKELAKKCKKIVGPMEDPAEGNIEDADIANLKLSTNKFSINAAESLTPKIVHDFLKTRCIQIGEVTSMESENLAIAKEREHELATNALNNALRALRAEIPLSLLEADTKPMPAPDYPLISGYAYNLLKIIECHKDDMAPEEKRAATNLIKSATDYLTARAPTRKLHCMQEYGTNLEVLRSLPIGQNDAFMGRCEYMGGAMLMGLGVGGTGAVMALLAAGTIALCPPLVFVPLLGAAAYILGKKIKKNGKAQISKTRIIPSADAFFKAPAEAKTLEAPSRQARKTLESIYRGLLDSVFLDDSERSGPSLPLLPTIKKLQGFTERKDTHIPGETKRLCPYGKEKWEEDPNMHATLAICAVKFWVKGKNLSKQKIQSKLEKLYKIIRSEEQKLYYTLVLKSAFKDTLKKEPNLFPMSELSTRPPKEREVYLENQPDGRLRYAVIVPNLGNKLIYGNLELKMDPGTSFMSYKKEISEALFQSGYSSDKLLFAVTKKIDGSLECIYQDNTNDLAFNIVTADELRTLGIPLPLPINKSQALIDALEPYLEDLLKIAKKKARANGVLLCGAARGPEYWPASQNLTQLSDFFTAMCEAFQMSYDPKTKVWSDQPPESRLSEQYHFDRLAKMTGIRLSPPLPNTGVADAKVAQPTALHV